MTNQNLIILSGPSGCGKTTLLNSVCNSESLSFVKAPKYSDRPARGENDDIIHVKEISLSNFDIVYSLNNSRYGLRLREIEDLFNGGKNSIIIISDFRVIKQLKNYFGNRSRTVFISSSVTEKKLRRIQRKRYNVFSDDELKRKISKVMDTLNKLSNSGAFHDHSRLKTEVEKDWLTFSMGNKSTEVRIRRLNAYHVRYIENIFMFDYVILNHSENRPEEMINQLINIAKEDEFSLKRDLAYPPLFVVSGPPGSGKKTLINILKRTAIDRIEIVTGESVNKIEDNIRKGRTQIVFTKVDRMNWFRTRWPSHCVPIYLFRAPEGQLLRLNDYIENISSFNHVLLNNTLKEDLYDQVFKIMDHYEEKRDNFISYSVALAIAQQNFVYDASVFSGILSPA